jgi:ribosomal protein S18 acetylase RimI-like enzyme
MANAGFVNRTQVAAPARAGFEIREAHSTDHLALRKFLTGLSPRVRYLRFFTGAPPTSQAMLRILTGSAGCTDALVAIENGAIIGHAMASDATGHGGSRRTEIGVVVADGRRGMGVGAALVRGLLARAQERGATVLVMEVLAENQQVITMIADHWPVTRRDQSGAYLTIHAQLPQPLRDKPVASPAAARVPSTRPIPLHCARPDGSSHPEPAACC